jgi:hypothetical protein
MTKEELTTLQEAPSDMVSIYDLFNMNERTLLYGYDFDRNTYHVYLKAGLIHLFIYQYDGTVIKYEKAEVFPGLELIPPKRIYPETCDLEFCTVLKEKGLNMSFTTFDENRAKATFYGKLMEE